VRGADVIVHDLNSTNGTFINGEKITESVLKPGQTLRLGQIEMRLETDGPAPAPAPAAPASAPVKKGPENTVVMQGVSLTDLETGARSGFDSKGKGFSKKDNKANKIFLYVAIAVGLIIVVLMAVAYFAAK
jgi:hypothetical protein